MTTLSLSIVAVCVIILSVLTLLSFKSSIEEVIFLNLRSGEIQNLVTLAYSVTILQQEAINILPIIDIYANYKYRLISTKHAEGRGDHTSFLEKLGVRIAVLAFVILFSNMFDRLTILFQFNSSIILIII